MTTQNATNIKPNHVINALSSGILTGGVVTVNGGDSAKFDISAGTGHVVDNYTDPELPTVIDVSFGPFVAQTVTAIATDQLTFIAINSAGAIVQQTTEPDQSEKRDLITLSVLAHLNNVSINTIGPTEEFAADGGSAQLSDLAISIGNINRNGNIFSANGANLTLDKTSGETFRLGANFVTSKKSPNIVTDPSSTALTFSYLYQDGAGGTTVGVTGTNIDPDQYDDGSGTLAVVGSNKWTIQHITFFTNSNFVAVEFGQNIYNSKAAAEASLNTENFIVSSGLVRGSFRTWLVVKKGTTSLADDANKFIEAGKFGSVSSSGGGGGGLTDIQGSYDNSVTPEMVLDATRGALTITDASAPLGANLFEVDNNAQTTTYFAVDATGAQIDGALTITTPLAVTEGGTGAATLADGNILLGSGTGSITALDVTAKGSLIVGDGTTDPVALAVGTNDFILTADSGEASGMKWAANAGGTGIVFLSSVTASTSASLDFASSIDSTYNTYLFIFDLLVPVNDGDAFKCRTSTDGGSNYDSTSTNYVSSPNIVGTTAIAICNSVGNAGDESMSGSLLLVNPSAAQNTCTIGVMGSLNSSTVAQVTTSFGMRKSAADVNAIQFLFHTGNIASGKISMYGMTTPS